MAIVALDIPKFRELFPEFSDVTDVQLQFLFDEATDYLNNTEYSPVQEYTKRERLLYLLMAHIAYLRSDILMPFAIESAEMGLSVGFHQRQRIA